MRYRIVETRDNDYIIQKKVLGLFWRDLLETDYFFNDNLFGWDASCRPLLPSFENERLAKEHLDISVQFPMKYRGHKIDYGNYLYVDLSEKKYRWGYRVYAYAHKNLEDLLKEIDKIEDKKIELKKPRIKRVCGEYYMGMTYE